MQLKIQKLLINTYNIEYIDIFFIKNNYDELITKYCNKMDINKINKFKKENDKLRALGSIILQKNLVYNIKNNEDCYDYKKIIIKKKENGKPYILYNNMMVNYNVSHDEDIVVIIYKNNIDIGIDIILASRKINFKIENFGKGFNRHQLWTLIEAYYKYIGTGINFDSDKPFFKKNYTNSIESNFLLNIISKKINLLNKDYYISIIHGII